MKSSSLQLNTTRAPKRAQIDAETRRSTLSNRTIARYRLALVSAKVLASLAAANVAAAVTPADLATRLAKNEPLLLIDVRPAAAYAEGHIPGAISIPLNLLPHKPLPAGNLVVVYGDGVGVVNQEQALELAKAKPGVKADVLEGGYAAWLAEARLSTAQPGVSAEKLPVITYDQLVAANKSDMVIVDLRGQGGAADAASARAASSETAAPGRQSKKSDAATVAGAALDATTAAASNPDVLANFAQRLGVPVVAAKASAQDAALRSGMVAEARVAGAAKDAAPAPNLDLPKDPAKLLVLVADDEAQANAIARQLRASGHYRFTVLIGGTEIIKHEGRQGSGRMDGGNAVIRN